MPNWCWSNVEIHASPDSVRKLNEEFEKASNREDISDFGSGWLGNLLLHIGMSEDEVADGDIRCRGAIEDIYIPSADCIQLYTSSAWCPHIYCIKAFVDHFVNDANIFYDANEPGCELYWTNDPEYVGCVNVEAYDVPDEYDVLNEYSYLHKGLIQKKLSEILGEDGTLDELVEMAIESISESNPDGHLSVHEFEYVEISKEET